MTGTRNPQSPTRKACLNRSRRAFTLVELLVTIAIIALLIGLVFKGVSRFRRAAYVTDTANEIRTIQNAIQEYYSTFNSYPGPLPMTQSIGGAAPTFNMGPGVTSTAPSGLAGSLTPIAITTTPADGFDRTGQPNLTNVTMAENLVLGLFGGLRQLGNSGTGSNIQYDPAAVGQGPASLNVLSPKKHNSTLDATKFLSWQTKNDKQTGHYYDEAGDAYDSIIPELVDRFPNGMPILYLRANKGYEMPGATAYTPALNGVVTNVSNAPVGAGQYQLEQIVGYTGAFTGTWPTMTVDSALPPTGRTIGEEKVLAKGAQFSAGGSVITPAAPFHGLRTVTVTGGPPPVVATYPSMSKGAAGSQYPYDAYSYLRNPTLSNSTAEVARQKNEYILISPGADRIYGTEDDIVSFGNVVD